MDTGFPRQDEQGQWTCVYGSSQQWQRTTLCGSANFLRNYGRKITLFYPKFRVNNTRILVKFVCILFAQYCTFSGSLPHCHLILLEATDGLMNQTQLRSLLCQCRVDQSSTSCIVQCNRCPTVHWVCLLISRRRRESYFEFVVLCGGE